MKFTILCVALIAALSSKVNAAVPEKASVGQEDAVYWNRFLGGDSSVPPTPSPTGVECDVEVTIECVNADGDDCDDIPARTDDCEEEVTYTYTFCNVGTNDMTLTVADRLRCEIEDEGEACTEQSFLDDLDEELSPEECTSTTEVVTIDFCVESETKTTLVGEATPPSGKECQDTEMYTVTVNPDPTDAPTPSPTGVECEVEVTIECENSDGDDCDEIPARNDDCDEEITYTYTFCNVGTNDMTLTVADRERGGETESFLDDLTVELSPQDCTTTTETDTLDLCVAGSTKTTLTGEATPPSGMECQDTNMYTIDIEIAPSTLAPTAASPVPSSAPSDFQCEVEIEVDCVPTDGSENCSAIPPLITLCEERPTEMMFKYNGGTCDQSSNQQGGDSPLFFCFDFQGGPPVEEGATSWIVVTDTKGQGIDYFTGEVAVGENFVVGNQGEQVGANMNVTIYSSSDTSPENILQTLVYHSSCSRNLFLKDRFGSIQLIVFVNDEQGVVDCFLEATFNYFVALAAESDPARLISLESIVLPEPGLVNLTDEIAGEEVEPGTTFLISQNITIDLTVRQRYTVFTTLVGQSSDRGGFCAATDFFTFVAGNALQPTVPTAAPALPPVGNIKSVSSLSFGGLALGTGP